MTRHLTALVGLVLSLTAASVVHAQTTTARASTGNSNIKATPRVTARLRVNGRQKTVHLVGRDGERVAMIESGVANAKTFLIDRRDVEWAMFDLEVPRGDVYEAVIARRWNTAARLLLGPMKPFMHYLDLPENNAAELVLQTGDYLMRGAEVLRRNAKTPEDEAKAKKQYEAAYAILKYAGKADWSSIGAIAQIKSIRCLLASGRPKTARTQFEELDEPFPGDAATGIYWLTKADLDMRDKKYRAGLESAVKSVVFENKDVDTYPDALLASAQCYEEVQNWYRARDIYLEVGSIFPDTDWADIATRRLRFIMKQGLTEEEEVGPIESVFFGVKEDMNEVVTTFLEKRDREERTSTRTVDANKEMQE